MNLVKNILNSPIGYKQFCTQVLRMWITESQDCSWLPWKLSGETFAGKINLPFKDLF